MVSRRALLAAGPALAATAVVVPATASEEPEHPWARMNAHAEALFKAALEEADHGRRWRCVVDPDHGGRLWFENLNARDARQSHQADDPIFAALAARRRVYDAVNSSTFDDADADGRRLEAADNLLIAAELRSQAGAVAVLRLIREDFAVLSGEDSQWGRFMLALMDKAVASLE